MHPRSFRILKVSCLCVLLHTITAGNSTTPASHSCGAEAVSSAPSSSATSQKPTKVLPLFQQRWLAEDQNLENLLFDDFFNKAIHKAQQDWRDVVAEATRLGIPCPAFSTALSWFDGYRAERLPAALLQAQRDYFGAHTFRVLPQFASDRLPADKDIHINWVCNGTNNWINDRLDEVEMFLRRRIRLNCHGLFIRIWAKSLFYLML